ncbi:hypothetical protein HN371_21475 [Candidatus Poribacteria bacterium]|jgi:hypothetical protein|nr:hypothetical protein [Candidatus Poribacteria bacterium]MBT5533867.1 hypothetical protein [Candidatus Poribacteria bacterium]MBT5711617.1 hypothetical protein [Candidatus Poribacteria bacterium]MBT7096971.1 hypothetical protein [Candidatus Poribacteria bacterium]MBT7806060.1 hypothetical protein [Candidatus Poribacteria bacterium]
MRRTLVTALLIASLALISLVQPSAQVAGMVDRALESMPPAGRAEVDAILAERGLTLDDVRNDASLAQKLMSSPEIQERVKRAMEGPGTAEAKAPPSQGPPASQERDPSEAPRPPRGQREGGLPERYQVIMEGNLFRRLGWQEQRHNPFGLAGVVHRQDGAWALITKQGRPAGLYVEVGADVGDGYTVSAIDGRSVKLVGGTLGEVTLELDGAVIGSRSGGGRPESRPTKQGPSDKGKGEKWYPVRGLEFMELVGTILGREGLTMQDVENDRDLQQSLKKKYQYLEDEGYTKFPDD